MGTLQKKKTGTDDTRIIIADISREADQDAIKLAIQPTFEGTTYQVPMITQIDFVNVTETIDPSQTPS